MIIIIPCVVSIIRRGAGSGRIIGLVIGVILLLGSWDLQPVSVRCDGKMRRKLVLASASPRRKEILEQWA